MSPALNPIALAAATLSLGAHAAVVGVLLFNPADEPSEVAHLVSIVTASALPSPPTAPQADEPTTAPKSPELPALEQIPERQTASTREIMPVQDVTSRPAPPGAGPAPTAFAIPMRKPAAPAPDEEPLVAAEPQELASLDPALNHPSPPRAAPTIRTEIAIVPGNTQPRYPLIARKRGYEGQAVVRVQVADTGRVLSATIASSSGHEVLDLAARDAVTAWRFQPATRDGQPTAGLIEVPIEFRLR